jgi:hypothetical protein
MGASALPEVDLITPVHELTVSNAAYTLAGTATDNSGTGLARVSTSLDNGQSWHVVDGLDTWTYTATLISGANIVRVRAEDNAGNTAETDPVLITFYDTSNPIVTSITLAQGSVVDAGEIEFTILFSEPMDASVEPMVTFGSDPAKVVTGQYTGAMTWRGFYTVTAGSDGVQIVSVSNGRDPYGNNMYPDESFSFVIDTTPPTQPLIASPSQDVSSHGVVITLAQASTDNISLYQLKGGLYGNVWVDTDQTDNFFFELEPLAWNTLEIRAVDALGRVSDADQVDIYRSSRLNPGDISGDLVVDLTDALIALRTVNGIDVGAEMTFDYPVSGADVNNDGKVGLEEILYIMQFVAGIR